MGVGFSERLRDAMIAADVANAEELARRCGVPALRVQDWLASEGECMTLREAIAVKYVLGKRPEYLLDGGESMLSVRAMPQAREVLEIMGSLRPRRLEYWKDIGRRLTKS